MNARTNHQQKALAACICGSERSGCSSTVKGTSHTTLSLKFFGYDSISEHVFLSLACHFIDHFAH